MLLSIALIFSILCLSNCSNILVLETVLSKSHLAIYEHLFEELTKRGHNITVISFYSREKPIPNYRVVSISSGDNLENRRVPVGLGGHTRFSMWYGVFGLAQLAEITCPRLLAHENIRNFLRENNTFDVIFFEVFNTNCDLGIAKKFGAPIIGEY